MTATMMIRYLPGAVGALSVLTYHYQITDKMAYYHKTQSDAISQLRVQLDDLKEASLTAQRDLYNIESNYFKLATEVDHLQLSIQVTNNDSYKGAI